MSVYSNIRDLLNSTGISYVEYQKAYKEVLWKTSDTLHKYTIDYKIKYIFKEIRKDLLCKKK